MTGRERGPWRAALLVLGVTVALSLALTLLHVPSAVLFGALLGGMAHALTSPRVLALPAWVFRGGSQGLIGITIGSLVSLSDLGAMGPALLRSWPSRSAPSRSACSPAGCWPSAAT